MKDKPKFLNGQIVWFFFSVMKIIVKVKIIMHQLINKNEFEYVIEDVSEPDIGCIKVHERTLFRTRRGALNKMEELNEMMKEVFKKDEERKREDRFRRFNE